MQPWRDGFDNKNFRSVPWFRRPRFSSSSSFLVSPATREQSKARIKTAASGVGPHKTQHHKADTQRHLRQPPQNSQSSELISDPTHLGLRLFPGVFLRLLLLHAHVNLGKNLRQRFDRHTKGEEAVNRGGRPRRLHATSTPLDPLGHRRPHRTHAFCLPCAFRVSSC